MSMQSTMKISIAGSNPLKLFFLSFHPEHSTAGFMHRHSILAFHMMALKAMLDTAARRGFLLIISSL